MNVSDPINALASQSNVASSALKARDKLDQNSFLKLMITQFRNQDPTKPQDPTAFLGQLAQFSTVSGIQDMQTSLSTLSDSLRSTQMLDGTVMVGHQVLARSDTNIYTAGGIMNGALDVPAGATSVQVSVKDSAGQLVRSMTVPAQQGLMDFAWDGVTDRGSQAATGRYSVSAVANVNGSSASVPVLMSSRVDSVTIDPKSNQLTLNTSSIGSISLGDVRRLM